MPPQRPPHMHNILANKRPKRWRALCCLACIGTGVCALAAAGAGERQAATRGQDNVTILYAGSLGALMEKAIGPAFEAATGYKYQGEGQGSVGAARAIRDQLRTPDIFISADPAVDENLLMGAKNHDLVKWYFTFASATLVIGYNPKSRFAADFERAASGKIPWYELLATPGVKFGRTDPDLDPKGYRTLFLFELAEQFYHRPALAKLPGQPENPAQVFPEPELLTRMEAGQLDAAVFYQHEVIAHHTPFITLPDEINQSNPQLAALYATRSYTSGRGATITGTPIVFSVTIPRTAHNAAGGAAFVRFLFGADAQARLCEYGVRALPVAARGELASVPAELRALLPADTGK
jgi:molybdate/tungstate transport system substrate-binding protein